MRLWHKDLIYKIPKKQLLGQHRECCALRGKGWGRKHSTVDYVFDNNYYMLYHYHIKIMKRMLSYGYKVDMRWFNVHYRGKKIGFVSPEELPNYNFGIPITMDYEEHNSEYYNECIENLRNKNIFIE